MINRKNEKGFTLVLSLVLLLVMSLMGGALIVISSGDHQSNNSSDEYQQTFYVAETALLEGEKWIINKQMGPWAQVGEETRPLDAEEGVAFDAMEAGATGNSYRYTLVGEGDHQRGVPKNIKDPVDTPCYNSFRNLLDKDTAKVAKHLVNENFGELIEIVFDDETELDNLVAGDAKNTIEKEKKHLKRFRYEYFIINIGTSNYRGSGTSLKKTTGSTRDGNAFKIFGCGYMMPKGENGFEDPDILVPIESIVTTASWNAQNSHKDNDEYFKIK